MIPKQAFSGLVNRSNTSTIDLVGKVFYITAPTALTRSPNPRSLVFYSMLLLFSLPICPDKCWTGRLSLGIDRFFPPPPPPTVFLFLSPCRYSLARVYGAVLCDCMLVLTLLFGVRTIFLSCIQSDRYFTFDRQTQQEPLCIIFLSSFARNQMRN